MLFQDSVLPRPCPLLYQNLRSAGSATSVGTQLPTELSIGYGTKAVATHRQFTEGDLTLTGNPLDVAIAGDGFFQVEYPDGSTVYTRDGAFKMSADGTIVTSEGYRLLPEITVPEDATSISIGADGTIEVMQYGNDMPTQIGQIELARFVNPQGLLSKGENLYAETEASGAPSLGNPGEDGWGRLQQGALEASNVDSTEELIEWKRTAARLKEIRQLLHVESRSKPW